MSITIPSARGTLRVLLALAMVLFVTPGCGAGSAKQPQEEKQEAKSEVTHLTKAKFISRVYDFEKNPTTWKYEGSQPAIVDFYATWCPPCKMLSPLLDELAGEYEGKISFYKVDVDQEKEVAAAFNVSSIPMLLWIPSTGEPFVTMGFMPKEELKKAIEEKLLK